MDSNLPATRSDGALIEADVAEPATTPLPRRQPIGVAFLPLSLVTFVILAITIAAWTFLAAGA